MPSPAVGRDAVLDRARAVLAGPGAVLLEGPAGIGKTVVWRALVAAAEQDGRLVLACAPTETETALPYAALADLLRPLAGLVPDLPGPQRQAAEVVLLAASDQAIEERAVGAATRSLLEAALTGDRPVLVAVDDAPWLDPPSEWALRFALRRLAPRLGVLVAVRSEGPEPVAAPLGLEPTRLVLPPLGVGALHHVLRGALGVALPRPLLARIAQACGGNPLLAIELARAVLRLPRLPLPGEDLPVASSVQQLLADALAALPAGTREAVRLAALLPAPTLRDLVAAGVDPAVLEPAEEAGLLAVGTAAVRFGHPLHAAAVRAGIPAGVRRRLHGILAGAVADPDERARQLARAAVGPDPAVAAEVAAAAGRQRDRGAPELAAELYDRAAALTPPGPDRGRRLLAAVRCRFDSGDYAAAGAAADAVAGELTGDERAEALLLRAIVAFSADDGPAAAQAARQALAEVSPGSPLTGRLHAHLALFTDLPQDARRHAEAAVALLTERDEDRELLAGALLQLFLQEIRLGRPARPELLDRALELEAGQPSWLAGTIPAVWWKSTDQHDLARDRLTGMLEQARADGDEPAAHEQLSHLGETELVAGRWAAAAGHIAAARELGEQLGSGLVGETWLAGLLHAYRGELAAAGAVADAGLRRAAETGDDWCRRIHLQLAGLVALSAGRWVDAARAYGELVAAADAMGLVEPLGQRFEPDWIEACVGAGDLDTGAAALDRLAERHARLPRPWTALGLARSRVLLAGATGAPVDGVLAELATARAAVPVDVVPLDRARCLLVAGLAHRRARRRREARDALTLAAAEFTALGAAAFAARAEAELARIGSRAPAPATLTSTEQQVALLAARGRTNREIADTLFISPKTVEANLGRIYRKLGISRRAELTAALG